MQRTATGQVIKLPAANPTLTSDADSQAQRRKRFSYIFLWIKLGYTLITIINLSLTYFQAEGPSSDQLVILGLASLGAAATLVCIWLVAQERVTLANTLILSIDIVIVLWWGHLSGGMRGAVPLFLFGVYSAQAFLLPRRLYFPIGGAGIVAAAVLLTLEFFNIGTDRDPSGLTSYSLNYLGGLLVVLTLSGYFSSSLNRAFGNLVQQKQELDTANTALLEQRRVRELVSGRVAAAAQQLSGRAQEQASRASTSATAVAESDRVVGRLSVEAGHIAAAAEEVRHAASETQTQLDVAQAKLSSGLKGMEQTVQQVNLIASLAQQLEHHSRQIGEIVQTIEQVASETHLLALNATIEAAGAGAYGRRFAIIADQVRRLADSSDQATVRVRTILAELRAEIGQVVEASSRGRTVAEQGSQQVQAAAAGTSAITSLSQRAAVLSEAISAATAQQRQASSEAVKQIQQLRSLVEQEATSAREGATAASSLQAAAEQLHA